VVRGDTVDQDVRCLLMDSRANMQAFFATQGEALVYFMMVILQCAPLKCWRALAFVFKKFSYPQNPNNSCGHIK
jgi:hypothetical protein